MFAKTSQPKAKITKHENTFSAIKKNRCNKSSEIAFCVPSRRRFHNFYFLCSCVNNCFEIVSQCSTNSCKSYKENQQSYYLTFKLFPNFYYFQTIVRDFRVTTLIILRKNERGHQERDQYLYSSVLHSRRVRIHRVLVTRYIR